MTSIFFIALVLLICILFGVIVWLALHQRRMADSVASLTDEIDELRLLVSALSASASGAGQDLVALRQKLHKQQLQSEPPVEAMQQDVARYDQASQLLQSGAQDETILQQCGLARAELDLLRAVGKGHSQFLEKE